MNTFLIFPVVFFLAYFGVDIFRRWTLHKDLLDIPNERSSHSVPTPRGGGLIIVVICLISYLAGVIFFPNSFAWSYLIGGLIIAIISWLDDVYSVSFVWRFIVHSLAAAILISGTGYWQEVYVPVFDITIQLGYFGAAITLLWIVWMVNAYNFMDGIDGIAGLQGVIAAAAWFLWGILHSLNGLSFFSGVIACACLGFLIHNWQPARIFMGDVGSSFLGFTFAAVPLLVAHEKPTGVSILPLIAISFVWFFVFDTVLTFIFRLIRKQKVWTAHREHMYQRLIIKGKSHSRVSKFYGCLSSLVIAIVSLEVYFFGILGIITVFSIVILSVFLIYLSFRHQELT